MSKLKAVQHRLGLATVLMVSGLALGAAAALGGIDGALDSSFSGDGKAYAGFNGSDFANDVAVQPDGKIVVAGSTTAGGGDEDFAIARFTPSGALDPTFGGDGRVVTGFGGDDVANGVAIQPNGKIVAAGTTDEDGDDDFAVARYNADGTPDSSFRGDGKGWFGFGGSGAPSEDRGNDVVLQADGKIVVVGSALPMIGGPPAPNTDFAVARLNASSGSLDPSFSSDGRTKASFGGSDYAQAVAMQGTRIVAAGYRLEDGDYDFAALKLTSTGTHDGSFGGDGKITQGLGGKDIGRGVAVDGNGTVLVAGAIDDEFGVARFASDGSLDDSFSSNGSLTTGFGGAGTAAHDVALQENRRVVVVGGTGADFAIARYYPDGDLDPSFAGDGTLTTNFDGTDSARGIAMQDDGKIVVSGHGNSDTKDFVTARYLGHEPPETRIVSGPASGSHISDPSPTFGFNSPDRETNFQCRIDTGNWLFCRSPKVLSELADGVHTFSVRALSANLSQTDPTPATRTFTVDTAAPETTIESVEVNEANAFATVRFGGVDPASASLPLSFRCRIDSEPSVPCDSPHRFTTLAPGRHVVRIVATDAAGNPDATPARSVFTLPE